MRKREKNELSFQEFCEHHILQGGKQKFYDTVFHALNQRVSTWQAKRYISQLEWVYHNLSNILYDEEKYEFCFCFQKLLPWNFQFICHKFINAIKLIVRDEIERITGLQMPKRKLTASKMTEPVTEGNTKDTLCFGEVPESFCEDVMAFWADL